MDTASALCLVIGFIHRSLSMKSLILGLADPTHSCKGKEKPALNKEKGKCKKDKERSYVLTNEFLHWQLISIYTHSNI